MSLQPPSGQGVGPGTNCFKIQLNLFSLFPTDLPKFPQIIVASELSIERKCQTLYIANT